MDAGTGSAISGAIGGTVGLIGNILNYVSAQHTNESNAAINQTNLDYNKAMTEAAWARDDNAHQREVADLQAAGLSPLAAMQGSGVSSPLGAPSPIAMQAPQIDVNSLINSAIKSADLAENIRTHVKSEDQRDKEIQNTVKELELKASQLKIQDKDVESQIKYRISIAKNESMRIAEMRRSNKANEKLRGREIDLNEAEYESKKYYEEIKHQAGGENVPYKVYDNFDDYLSARQTYLDALNSVIDDFMAHPQKSAASGASNVGFGAGAQGISGNIHGGSSESQYVDVSPAFEAEWYKFQHKYPVPVFIQK